MILWLDGAADPRRQMARDAGLLAAVAAGRLREPVLRLFAFAPPGITLGRLQDPARELDLERLARDGVPWAVRPTGGRAIFHAEEWTFSLATPLGPGGWAADPAAAYARTGALLAAALAALGVPAALAPGAPRAGAAPRGRGGPAPPCFASAARHELTLAGRKLAGIAQRRVRAALLQQGSLLLGAGHLRLADYARVPEAERPALRAALAAATAGPGGALGADAPLSRLADALTPLLPDARRLAGADAGPLAALADAAAACAPAPAGAPPGRVAAAPGCLAE